MEELTDNMEMKSRDHMDSSGFTTDHFNVSAFNTKSFKICHIFGIRKPVFFGFFHFVALYFFP